MTQHDPYEQLQEGVTLHGLGDLQGAADARFAAIEQMSMDDPHRPGAVAAYAFTGRLLGQQPLHNLVDMAEQALDDGLDVASDENRSPEDRAIARRESYASALHAGALVARLAIDYDRQGDREYAEGQYGIAAGHIKMASDGARQLAITDGADLQFLHQWEINTARRHAAISALDPEQSTLTGLGRAAKAIAMSPFSESSMFTSGTNPESSFKAKARAKAKSFIGGVASAAVCGLMLVPNKKASAKALTLAESKFVF